MEAKQVWPVWKELAPGNGDFKLSGDLWSRKDASASYITASKNRAEMKSTMSSSFIMKSLHINLERKSV